MTVVLFMAAVPQHVDDHLPMIRYHYIHASNSITEPTVLSSTACTVLVVATETTANMLTLVVAMHM
jgi:hypothetical protein